MVVNGVTCGVLMPLDVDAGTDPAYIVIDSDFSAVIAGHIRGAIPADHDHPINDIFVRERQGGITRDLKQVRRPAACYRNSSGDTPPVLTLYSSLRIERLSGQRVIMSEKYLIILEYGSRAP